MATMSLSWSGMGSDLIEAPLAAASAVISALLLNIFRALTALWHLVRYVASTIVPDKDRAPRRLHRSPRYISVGEDGEIIGLDRLPPVPPLPPHLGSVAIAGCANLACYSFGAAYALQQAPNAAVGELVVSGGSSGAFVAAPFALGVDCARIMLRLSHETFVRHRRRVGGCIGIYSAGVRGILSRAFAEAAAARGEEADVLVARASEQGRLRVSVTRFAPLAEHLELRHFADAEALLDAVLASCYIPIAYEAPVRIAPHGFCVDGCSLHFLPDADLLISPYHCHLAEIAPAREQYPYTMVFNLLHSSDILVLWEDGYLDTVRWLQSGGASRRPERDARQREVRFASMRALLGEAMQMVLETTGLASPPVRAH